MLQCLVFIKRRLYVNSKICAALATGKHCIDASHLKQEQMIKYADSAKNAIVNRTLDDGSEGMVAYALWQVLEPQKENSGQFKLIEVTNLQSQDLPPSKDLQLV